MNKLPNCIYIFALVLLAMEAVAVNHYVSLTGTNNSPYTNWPDAATNIQWAVNVGVNNDTVWISNGVYVLTNQITVNSNIAIRGNAGESVIVNGNNSNRCFLFNSRGSLSNVFVTRGYTNGNGGGVYMPAGGSLIDCVLSNNIAGTNGGGLFMGYLTASAGNGQTKLSVLVQRCTFVANTASNSGGGMYHNFVSTGVVDSCTFYTNTAGLGGGFYIDGACGNVGVYLVTNCNIICNVAASYGGAFYQSSGGYSTTSPQIITYCNICSNVATDSGGGITIAINASGYASYCLVSNNIASNLYGGVQVAIGTMKNSRIERNTCGSSVGGVLMNQATSTANNPALFNCIVTDNTGQQGGGILIGYASVIDCLIKNNVNIGVANSGIGGGILQRNFVGYISGCTIVSNSANGNGGGGIGIFQTISTSIVDNCIIYFNNSGTTSNWFDASASGSSFSNCCLAPAISGAATNLSTNNITSAPQFVSQVTGDYHLAKTSPCVNAGVNRDWMAGASDLDNLPRIYVPGGTVDMGCYELIYSPALVLAGQTNANGLVTVESVAGSAVRGTFR